MIVSKLVRSTLLLLFGSALAAGSVAKASPASDEPGRTLAGRRWSDGLHQAVEAKEGVPVQRENQTLASVTFQNLFRTAERSSPIDRLQAAKGLSPARSSHDAVP